MKSKVVPLKVGDTNAQFNSTKHDMQILATNFGGNKYVRRFS